jgi:carboxymethylenebutenolidase
MLAETVRFRGHNGDEVDGYFARPLGAGPFPGLVIIHHAPGLDEETEDVTRRLGARGFATLTPYLYTRESREVDPATAAKLVRAGGGLRDDQMLGDVAGAVARLRSEPYSSGRVGILGFCSGGRQAYLAACQIEVEAAIDCYGGSVVAGPEKLTATRPTAPIDLTGSLSCPTLGIFGGQDPHVPPEHIAAIDARMAAEGKVFEYHVYQDAPHAFLGHYHVSYRVEAAMLAWERIFDFLDRHLVHG